MPYSMNYSTRRRKRSPGYLSNAPLSSNTYLIIGAVIIGGFVIMKGVKSLDELFVSVFGGKTSEEKKQEAEQVAEQQRKIDQIYISANKLNKPITAYNNIADTLHSAMAGPGTDEDAIIDALTGLNPYELIQVYKSFSLRADPAPSIFAMFGSEPVKYNLFQWFSNELSGSDLQKVKKIFQPTNLWN